MIVREISVLQEIAEPILYEPPPLPPFPDKWVPTFPAFLLRELALPTSTVPHTEAIKPYVIITLTGNKLLAPINLGETWAEHFASRGWDTIREQVEAGYPIYAQPTPQFGSYREVVDYGAVFNNVIANIDFATAPKFGTVHVTCSIRHSLNGLDWSEPVFATSLFVQSFRFLEVTITFEGVN